MTIPYLYHPRQIHNPNSTSKSPLKPLIIHECLKDDLNFEHFAPALIQPIQARDLYPVHSHTYINALFACETADGFGNKNADHMRAIRMTAGNFMLAADIAINPAFAQSHPGAVLSLTSGFHHASHEHASGFCTLNALNAAAYHLHQRYGAKTLIVDGDWHYGDGCADIIDKANQDGYLAYFQHHTPDLAAYSAALIAAIDNFEPDVIFYQAGADAWIDDPLGGGLTMQELFDRDLITLTACLGIVDAQGDSNGIPIVVNLAGGYAKCYENTIRIHMNTVEAMKQVFLKSEPKPDFTVTVSSGIM